MTEKIAAGRKTDPFEELLLAEVRLCHDEILTSRQCMRDCEDMHRNGKANYCDTVQSLQRELDNISRLIDDTAKLAKTAARLRGQNIRVVRATETVEGGPGEGV